VCANLSCTVCHKMFKLKKMRPFAMKFEFSLVHVLDAAADFSLVVLDTAVLVSVLKH